MSCRLFSFLSLLFAAFTPIALDAAIPGDAKPPVIKPPVVKPSVVKVVKAGGGFQLLRNGRPYVVKGAGGDGSKTLLRSCGGNSFRTWGADDLEPKLAEAQSLGLTVTIGIWLGHREYFNYHDAAQVAAQKESTRKAILRYRNSPALLVWALGNEMEVGEEGNADMWAAIEDLAKMAHALDPNHPTMTVVAEIGGGKVKQINALCPDIDIVGINSYGGGPSVSDRYEAAGGVKPYMLTEYGPPGVWEQKANAWGAVPEPSSTAKAASYRAAYEKSIAAQPLCLGSYAFTWGHKQEATATWFGLLLPDGSRLGATDTLTQLWTGKPPAHPCPVIGRLTVAGPDQVPPGTTVKATLDASDPRKDPITVQWVLQADAVTYHTGGGAEGALPIYPEAIVSSSPSAATVQMPIHKGGYRLFAYVRDTHGGAAVANVPLFVQSDSPTPPAQKAALPLVLYGPDAHGPLPLTSTKSWKPYTLDLKGLDLSRIKTGFCWTLAATGKPVTFYLDDIRYG